MAEDVVAGPPLEVAAAERAATTCVGPSYPLALLQRLSNMPGELPCRCARPPREIPGPTCRAGQLRGGMGKRPIAPGPDFPLTSWQRARRDKREERQEHE